jgi:hypothetical protein
MDHVEFEGDSFGPPQRGAFHSRQVFGIPQTPGMVSWLVKKGVVKSEKTAGTLLIIATALSFVLSGYICYIYLYPKAPPISHEQVKANHIEKFQNNLPSDLPAEIRDDLINKLNGHK